MFSRCFRTVPGAVVDRPGRRDPRRVRARVRVSRARLPRGDIPRYALPPAPLLPRPARLAAVAILYRDSPFFIAPEEIAFVDVLEHPRLRDAGSVEFVPAVELKAAGAA